MAKNSPSQLRTKSARISKHAYAVLAQLAVHNGTSVADELDRILSLEQQGRLALNNHVPFTFAPTKKLKLSPSVKVRVKEE